MGDVYLFLPASARTTACKQDIKLCIIHTSMVCAKQVLVVRLEMQCCEMKMCVTFCKIELVTKLQINKIYV